MISDSYTNAGYGHPATALWDPAFDDLVVVDHEAPSKGNDEPVANWLNYFQALVDPADQIPAQPFHETCGEGSPSSPVAAPEVEETTHLSLDHIEDDMAIETWPTPLPEPFCLVKPLGFTGRGCVQCRQKQYVNQEGRCMVCQHYFDMNTAWEPRFGKSERYRSHNSSSSTLGSIGSLDSVVSAISTGSKRGKRILGGYPCGHLGCDMTFNVPSELRHHVRNHKIKAHRPYGCEVCSDRFLYPKDLVRHSQNVHKDLVSTNERKKSHPPSENDMTATESLELDDSTFKRRKRRRARSSLNDCPHTSLRLSDLTLPGIPDDLIECIDKAVSDFDSTQEQPSYSDNDESWRKIGVKTLVRCSKRWLGLIDEILYRIKRTRDEETSDAIAKLLRQLDDFNVED